MLACSAHAWANPTGAKVAAGAASFATSGSTLNVTNAPGTIINWRAFSIEANEQTRFIQQSASSAVLNRVVGSDASSILGTLSSNGRVFLVNPHGILFGAGARIDTAAFIASTLNIVDGDFLAGRLKFEGGGGALRNDGTIRASADIILVGPAIENSGIIRSETGSVLIAAGRSVTITSPDAQGVRFELQAPSDSVLNVGSIEAPNAVGMFAATLRHSGEIRATDASVDAGGRVVLSAQREAVVDTAGRVSASGARGGHVVVQSGGTALIAGSIEAAGHAGAGGSIHVLGDHVGVLAGADLNASGDTGGGAILVGGDYRGENPSVQNASRTYVANGAALRADASVSGDGGKVIVWADDITRYGGSITARGGAASGDGGFVEVSGKGVLDFAGGVDTRAPRGEPGTLLLDPTTYNIVAANTAEPDTPESPAGTFEEHPASTNAVSEITTSRLHSALVNGNVTLNTRQTGDGNGSGAGDINFNAAFDYNGAGGARTLTLIAARDVNIHQPISSAVQPLDIVLNTGGATNIRAAVGVNALSIAGALSLNGATLAVASDLSVPGTFDWTSGTITGAGALNTSGTTTLGGGTIILSGKTWNNSGTITIGPQNLDLQAGSTLNNLAAGVVNLSSGASFTGAAGGTNTVNNAGVLNKLVGGGNTNINNSGLSAFNNTNRVNVAADLLNMNAAGIDSGRYDVASGAALTFGTSRTFDSGTSFTGTGALNFSGGTQIFSAAHTLAAGPTLTLNGSTLSAANTLEIAGAFNWTSGTIGGAGALNTSGTTTLGGGTIILSGKIWNNSGTITIGPQNLDLQAGSTLNNLAPGTINLSTGASFTGAGGGTNVVNNAGTLTKLAGGGNTNINNSGLSAFNNSAGGVINVAADLLNMNTVFIQDGTLDIESGATLSTNGQNLTNGSTGVIGGSGTLALAGNTVTNDGTLRPGPASGDTTATLTIQGNLVQGASGQIETQLGGTAAGDFDVLAVSGNAALAGTLNLSTTGGYTATSGDNFTVLTAPAVSGTFATVNKTFSNSATPIYNATNVVVALGAGGTLNSWVFDGDGSWNDAARWSLGHVPAANEQVSIDRPADVFTITIPAGTFSVDLLNSNENITIAGIVGVANASSINGTLAINGGTLQGAGPVTVNGALVLAGGVLGNTGGVTVNGTTSIASGAAQVTATLATGALSITGGTLNIAAGGVLDLTGPGANTVANASVANAGTLKLSGKGNLMLNAAAPLSNSGAVRLESGTLVLAGGGTHTGLFALDAGTTLEFAGGTHELAAASNVTGSGTARFNGGTVRVRGAYGIAGTGVTVIDGGTADFNTTAPELVFAQPLTLNGGTLAWDRRIVTNGLTWAGGTLKGPDSVPLEVLFTGNFTTRGATSITGRTAVTLGVVRWRNFGTITQTGWLELGRGTTVFNESPGVWNLNDGTLNGEPNFSGVARGNADFVNYGFFNSAVDWDLRFLGFGNYGQFNVTAGTLELDHGVSVPDNGIYSVAAGATLRFSGTRTLGSGSDVTGNGTVQLSLGPRVLIGGQQPSGTIVISDRYSVAATGKTVIDGGTVQFDTPATVDFSNLTLSDGTLTGSGALAIEAFDWSGGTIAGNGTLITRGLTTVSGGAAGSTRPWTNLGTFAKALTQNGNRALPLGPFSNTGQVEINAGILQLTGHGTHGGAFNVAAGSTLAFAGGTQALMPTSDITGAGTVLFDGATVLVNGQYAIALTGHTRIDAGIVNFSTPAAAVSFANPLFIRGGTLTGRDDFVTNGLDWRFGGRIDSIGGVRTLTTHGVSTIALSTNSDGLPFGELENRAWTNAGAANLGSTLFITNGSPITNMATGVIEGSGTVSMGSGTFTNNGLFVPEHTIQGHYVQGPAGRLSITLSAPGQGPALTVEGRATLDGALDLALASGYAGEIGAFYDVLRYESHSGDFASINAPARIAVTANTVSDSPMGSANHGVYRLTQTQPSAATVALRAIPANDVRTGNDKLLESLGARGASSGGLERISGPRTTATMATAARRTSLQDSVATVRIMQDQARTKTAQSLNEQIVASRRKAAEEEAERKKIEEQQALIGGVADALDEQKQRAKEERAKLKKSLQDRVANGDLSAIPLLNEINAQEAAEKKAEEEAAAKVKADQDRTIADALEEQEKQAKEARSKLKASLEARLANGDVSVIPLLNEIIAEEAAEKKAEEEAAAKKTAEEKANWFAAILKAQKEAAAKKAEEEAAAEAR